jgi:hypothetical protein
MEFFLTDLGLGLTALLGVRVLERLAAHRPHAMSLPGRGRSCGKADKIPVPPVREVRPARKAPPLPPAGTITVDPRRLVRLW